VLPGNSPDQDRDLAAFGSGEGPFHRTLELLLDIYQAGGHTEAGALRINFSRDFIYFSSLVDYFWHAFSFSG
jgi:hypothetical protein